MPGVDAFLNGKFLPIQDACINIEDRGTLFGDGVYEYVIVYNGKLFQVDEHLDRLWYSAEEIEIPVPYTREQVKQVINKLVSQINAPEAGVYIELTRGAAARVHHFPDKVEPNFFVVIRELEPMPSSLYTEGIKVMLLPDERWKRCDIKSLNLLPNVLAKQKAKKMGYYDAIFFSERGVTEGTSNSVLAVLDGVLVTAPPGPWILPGITRKTVLDIAKDAGIPTEERFFEPKQLVQAEEVMLTSTRIGVLPVTGLNGSKVASGAPGPVYRRLAEKFSRLIIL